LFVSNNAPNLAQGPGWCHFGEGPFSETSVTPDPDATTPSGPDQGGSPLPPDLAWPSKIKSLKRKGF